MYEGQELDRKDLKIQALLEKVSNLTAQYENQAADFRVELTISEAEREKLQNRIKELEAPDVSETPNEKPAK